MLRLESVGRRFAGGIEALADVTLTIEDGGFLALLGPSGCGKSTLLRLIAGLDAPDVGAVRWESGKPPAPGRIGMVFQEAVLLPWANARQNAALPLRLRGTDATEADTRAEALLAELGLAAFAAARPATLSGGMKMRVALARALSTAPDLLLLDEPFAALDEPTRHRLQEDLRRLHRTHRCTIVLVTHSLYEAAYCAQRVAILTPRPGRLSAEITMAPHQGRLDPAYLGAVAALTQAMPA